MADIALLTLANHAEVQNGLLYISGAEWDTLTRSVERGKPSVPHHLAIALSVVIPWIEANLPQQVRVWIEDEDSRTRLFTAELDIEAGRPPGRAPGTDSRSSLAISADVTFPHEGGFRVVAEAGEARRQRTYSFRVVDRVVSAAKAD